MVTILLERKNLLEQHILLRQTCSLVVPRDGGRIEIVSESRRQFASVDSSIVKGPIRLRDSRGQNLATDTNSCERLYQALF